MTVIKVLLPELNPANAEPQENVTQCLLNRDGNLHMKAER